MDFYVERSYKSGASLPWRAEIYEELPALRKHEPTRKVYHSQVIAITRLGLYLAVRRRCRQVKRNRTASPPKGQKTWKVRV